LGAREGGKIGEMSICTAHTFQDRRRHLQAILFRQLQSGFGDLLCSCGPGGKLCQPSGDFNLYF